MLGLHKFIANAKSELNIILSSFAILLSSAGTYIPAAYKNRRNTFGNSYNSS